MNAQQCVQPSGTNLAVRLDRLFLPVRPAHHPVPQGARPPRDATRHDGFTPIFPSGGHSGGALPDPIPNSVVKPSSADDTAWATAWERRSPPEPHTSPRGGSSPPQGSSPPASARASPQARAFFSSLRHRFAAAAGGRGQPTRPGARAPSVWSGVSSVGSAHMVRRGGGRPGPQPSAEGLVGWERWGRTTAVLRALL